MDICIFNIIIKYIRTIIATDLLKRNFLTSLYGVLHIILSLCIGFGSLFFGYHKIHLIVILIVIGTWFIFNNKCYLQIKHNQFCKLDKNEPFKDIQNIFFQRVLQVKNKIYKWILILIIIFYDLYHILYW